MYIHEINKEDYLKLQEEINKEWLNENCGKSQLLSSSILPLRPDIGYFINVNGIDIPKNIFTNEFNIISEVYYSVIDKLDKHYKNNK
jgi:hypothetical protein